MKRSEYISQFLNFIEQAKTDYQTSLEGIKLEEKRQEDLLHEIEFCRNAKERSKLATRLHKCREERRKFKDIHGETSRVVTFVNDPANKKTFDKLTQVLGSVRKEESYQENRVYRPRVKESEE